MVSISNNAYSTNNLYNNPYDKLTEKTSSSTVAKPVTQTKSTSQTGDTVSLSEEVATARTREAMGLNPTGPLKLSDFTKAAENQTKTINEKLASLIKEQDISSDQKITLSFDSKSNITIKENFSGKSKLEKALNSDKDFSIAFNSLNSNSQIINYTKELQTRISNTNLSDFMNSDNDWSDIMSLASKYSEMKSSANPLATLVGIGNSQNPYSFTYNPEK